MNTSHASNQPVESKFGRFWLITWLAIAALLLAKSIWWQSEEPNLTASAAPAVRAPLTEVSHQPRAPQLKTVHTFKAIEDLRVGDRVVSDNPDTPNASKLAPGQTAVDPATWKKVTLYAEETWPDGTLDTIHITTLQPPLWLELFEAKVGSHVPPPLDLVEMGLPEHLQTTVVSIEACPPIASVTGQEGGSRVVLTTVNHLNPDVWQLTAVNQSGRREQLKPTGFHKFYSETRHDWVSTKDIHDREVIRGRAGPLTIVACEKLPGTQRVYNLTVEGEHVYYVSELGLLAHNNCENVRVFRVEGPGNQALNVHANGNVDILRDGDLSLNFDNFDRALEFLEITHRRGHTDNVIKSFQVPRGFLEELNATAIFENQVRKTAGGKGLPLHVDLGHNGLPRGQFTLRPEQVRQLSEQIVPGSGLPGHTLGKPNY